MRLNQCEISVDLRFICIIKFVMVIRRRDRKIHTFLCFMLCMLSLGSPKHLKLQRCLLKITCELYWFVSRSKCFGIEQGLHTWSAGAVAIRLFKSWITSVPCFFFSFLFFCKAFCYIKTCISNVHGLAWCALGKFESSRLVLLVTWEMSIFYLSYQCSSEDACSILQFMSHIFDGLQKRRWTLSASIQLTYG